MQASHAGVSAAKLLRLPFSRAELFAAAVLGGFAHPATAALFALTCVVLLPLGATAGTLFVFACVALSWTVLPGAAEMLRSRAALVVGALVLLGIVAFGKAWLPPSVAARAAAGDLSAVAGLAAWDVAAVGAALLLLGSRLGRPSGPVRRSRKTRPLVGFPAVPRPIGVAAAKELRILCRTADALVAGGIGVLGAATLLVGDEPTPALLGVVPVLLVLAQAGAPLNAFGLDRAGIDRYRLLPLRGSEMLVSKNLAFLALLLFEVAPLVLVAAWRFGAGVAAALVFGVLAYAIAALLVGNVSTARAVAPREFDGVESIDQSGGILPVALLLVAWIPAAAVAGVTAPLGAPAMAGAELLLAALFAAAWARSLPRAGRELEARFDELRDRLAA
jgi:hypothetical protein